MKIRNALRNLIPFRKVETREEADSRIRIVSTHYFFFIPYKQHIRESVVGSADSTESREATGDRKSNSGYLSSILSNKTLVNIRMEMMRLAGIPYKSLPFESDTKKDVKPSKQENSSHLYKFKENHYKENHYIENRYQYGDLETQPVKRILLTEKYKQKDAKLFASLFNLSKLLKTRRAS